MILTLNNWTVPFIFFVGKEDIQTSTKIAVEYFEELKAPKKDLFLFEDSGHQIHQDEPEKFQRTIIRTFGKNKIEI